MGAGLWLASLNVQYRDFRYVVPFLVQLGLYVSPVGFSSAIVPEKWQPLYALNPMVGVIEGARWGLPARELLRVLAYPKFRLQIVDREWLLEDLLPWCDT